MLANILMLSHVATVHATAATIAQRNAENPLATYSADALSPHNVGGCYHGKAPSSDQMAASADLFTFSEEELLAAADGPSIDWRQRGAVGPIQQQHPFGTCWAFSTTAVTEVCNPPASSRRSPHAPPLPRFIPSLADQTPPRSLHPPAGCDSRRSMSSKERIRL